MEFKIKNLHDAACRNIRSMGKYKNFDKFHDRNQIKMKTAYVMLLSGRVDYIYLVSDNRLDCLHRSPREGVDIQFSHGWVKDGKVIPTYHDDLNSFEELSKEGFPSGIWRAVKNAA